MEKILFVISDSYPHSGACTNIVSKIINELNRKYEISILSLNGEESGTSTFSVQSYQFAKLSSIKNPIKKAAAIFEKSIIKIQKSLGIFFINRFDYRAYMSKLKKISADKYDYIFSISGIAVNTLACLDYCKKYGGKLIVYQVDPLVYNSEYPAKTIEKRKHLQSRINNEPYLLLYPDYLREISEVKPENSLMLNLPLVNICAESHEISSNRDKPVCTFVGNIYGSIRNPDYTVKLIERIGNNNVEFNFIGATGNSVHSNAVNCLGTFSVSDAKKAMLNSDFLINIGNNSKEFIPSKIYDYISTGKPIINICKFADCPTIEILKDYDNKLNLVEDYGIFEENVNRLREFLFSEYNMQNDLEIKYYKSTPKYFAEALIGKIS